MAWPSPAAATTSAKPQCCQVPAQSSPFTSSGAHSLKPDAATQCAPHGNPQGAHCCHCEVVPGRPQAGTDAAYVHGCVCSEFRTHQQIPMARPSNTSYAQYGLSARYWATPLILIHFRRMDLIRRSNSSGSKWSLRPSERRRPSPQPSRSLRPQLMPSTTQDWRPIPRRTSTLPLESTQ